MQAGRLRSRVQLQEPVMESDPDGFERVTGYATIATVWAEVRPLSGKNLILARTAGEKVDAEITIRYRVDVTSQWRVVDGTHTYEMTGPPVDRENRKRSLTMLVREVT